MLKYFNFGILLTTLGIVSVAHASITSLEYEDHMPAPNPINLGLTPFNRGIQPLPEGAKRIKNTNMFYVMPDEIEIQKHPYVKPDGLTDAEVNAYRQEVLKQTNMYREKYGLNPVTLNDDMNNHAQEWANVLAPEADLRHRTEKDNNIYGENLYYISDFMENLGEVAVNAWYNELRFVRVDDDEDTFEHNPRGKIGHLTQLLWKKSKDMGVGVAKNNNGGYVVVANYNPGGNVKAFYKDNLPEFTQKDIDQAKEANELHEKKLKTPVIKKINRQSLPNFSQTLSPLNPQYGDLTNRYLPNNMFGNMGPQGLSRGMSKSGTTSDEDNMALPGIPEGAKRIKNTNMFYTMPDEIEIEKHSYEKPDGLTDAEVNAYRQEVLKQTNMYREKYGLNPVTLNDDMNNHAQEWANILAPEENLRHRTDQDNNIYGENLYYISVFMENLGEVAVNAWYNELRFVRVDDDEDNLENNPRGEIGHLTQLLWKKSKDMGVGVAKNNKGGYVVVANYNPGGNVKAFFKDNLPEFTQKDIDQANEAHELHQKKLRAPVYKKIDPQSLPIFSRKLSPSNPQYGDLKNGYLPNNMFGNMGPQGLSNRISNLQKLLLNMGVQL